MDPSRVGGPENPLLSGGDLSTIIGPGRGDASFDSFGVSKYQNRRNISSTDRALINAFREISTMADRINLPKTIVDRANNLFKQVRKQLAIIIKKSRICHVNILTIYKLTEKNTLSKNIKPLFCYVNQH